MSFGINEIDGVVAPDSTPGQVGNGYSPLQPSVPRITTAGLRGLAANDPKADRYILTDEGKNGTLWKKRGPGLASEDNGGTILVTTDLIVYEHQYKGAVNARWFGATGDGTTDDSLAVKQVLSLIDAGKTKKVRFPAGTYLVNIPAQTTISDKSNFSIDMDPAARFINNDFADGYTDAKARVEEKTAIITTSVPHKYTSGIQVILRDFPDNAYNGVFTISVADPYTFKFPIIPNKIPAGNSIGKTCKVEINRCLITLNNCSKARIKLNFDGRVQPSYAQHRLGWVALKLLKGCSGITADLDVTGLSYGISSGNFLLDEGNLKNSIINVRAKHVGYAIALWKSGDKSTFNLQADTVQRGIYATGVNNSKFNILARNYNVTGILIGIHYVGTTCYGSTNLVVNFKDTGSDILPYFKIAYPVAIGGYPVDSFAEIRNIDINIETTNVKFSTPLYIRTFSTLHKVSDIRVKATIDRSKLTDAEIANEMVIGAEDEPGKSGTYSGIKFLSWRVFNPESGTTKPMNIKVAKLADNISFSDLLSDSPRRIILPPDKKVVFPKQRIYNANTTDDITNDLLNRKYPVNYFPVGTTVFYYIRHQKYVRKTATEWKVSTSATMD